MNFNILNPNAFHSSQQVQKVASSEQDQLIRNEPSDNNAYITPTAPQDTVTLSQRAMNGEQSGVVDNNTYAHLMTTQRISNSTIEIDKAHDTPAEAQSSKPETLADIDTKNFLSEAMKTMVENRLGVDKEKIEAMIEEIGKDESLSAEEKEERIVDLQEMLDKEYEKAAEKQANQQQ